MAPPARAGPVLQQVGHNRTGVRQEREIVRALGMSFAVCRKSTEERVLCSACRAVWEPAHGPVGLFGLCYMLVERHIDRLHQIWLCLALLRSSYHFSILRTATGPPSESADILPGIVEEIVDLTTNGLGLDSLAPRWCA